MQTSSSPLCRCTARKTWSPSRGSNNKYFPMQETQCDKFGVSGGLGEPRFGLKLWLGSMDRMDESSSKSWVLFRGLPYRAIVIGVDLCMFMSMEKTSRDAAPEPWRGARSLARPAAAAFVWRGGRERGGGGRPASAPRPGHRERALSPRPFVPAGDRARRGAERRGRAAAPGVREQRRLGAARPGLGGRRSHGARSAGENKRLGNALRAAGTVVSLLRRGRAALPRPGCRWRVSLAAGARGAPKMPREIAREHLTWSGQRPGRQKSASRGGRLGGAAPADGAAHRRQPRRQGERRRNVGQRAALRAGEKKRAAVIAAASIEEQKVQPRAREGERFHVSIAQQDFCVETRFLRSFLM